MAQEKTNKDINEEIAHFVNNGQIGETKFFDFPRPPSQTPYVPQRSKQQLECTITAVPPHSAPIPTPLRRGNSIVVEVNDPDYFDEKDIKEHMVLRNR